MISDNVFSSVWSKAGLKFFMKFPNTGAHNMAVEFVQAIGCVGTELALSFSSHGNLSSCFSGTFQYRHAELLRNLFKHSRSE